MTDASVDWPISDEEIKLEEDRLKDSSLGGLLDEVLTVRVAAYVALRVKEVERRTEHRLRNEEWIKRMTYTISGIAGIK